MALYWCYGDCCRDKGGEQVQIVRCNSCGRWIGRDGEVGVYHDNGTEYCPECRCTDALMDVDNGCSFDDWEPEKLWEVFGSVPVNGDGGIQEEFLGFQEGTDRNEIWQWFDGRYSKGVPCLAHRGW